MFSHGAAVLSQAARDRTDERRRRIDQQLYRVHAEEDKIVAAGSCPAQRTRPLAGLSTASRLCARPPQRGGRTQIHCSGHITWRWLVGRAAADHGRTLACVASAASPPFAVRSTTR